MWVNWVLKPLNITDADGGKIAYYRLFLDGGWGVGEAIAWITNNILYLPVVIPTGYAAQALTYVVEPGRWLEPIENAWTSVTAKIFSIASPLLLIAIVLVAATVSITVRTPNPTVAMHAIAQRIVASLLMAGLIMAFLYNPAGTLLNVLTGWVRLMNAIFGDLPTSSAPAGPAAAPPDPVSLGSSAGGSDTTISDGAVLTQFLRPLTWMLNYGSQLSPDCGRAWAKMIENGSKLTCLDDSQMQATQSVGIACVMTLVALIPVWIYCRFAAVVIVTFVTHVTLAILRFASAAAMAAASVYQDRPLDEFLRFMASAAANLVIASGVIGLAKGGPALAVAAAAALTDSTLVHFAVLTVSYYLLAAGVWWLEARHGPIRDWLTNNIQSADEQSKAWKLLFPGGLTPQNTAIDRMVAQLRHFGSHWATQARERVKQMIDKNTPDNTSSTPGFDVSVHNLPPDTPETQAALEIVNIIDTTQPGPDSAGAPATALIESILTQIAPRWQLPAGGGPGHRQPAIAAVTLPPGTPAPAMAAPSATPATATAGQLRHTRGHEGVTASIPSAAPTRSPWRQHLHHQTRALVAATTTDPELMALASVQTLNAAPPRWATLNDSHAGACAPLDPRASLSAHVARIGYLEIVLRALGYSGDIGADLPSNARFFASGIDEHGNWTTSFSGN